MRDRARAQVAALPDAVTRLEQPATYPVSLDSALANRRAALLAAAGA